MSDSLTSTFAALADPTRRAIIARLARGEASVNALKQPFALSQPAISKHIKVLEKAGLISRARLGQVRPCRLETAPLNELKTWVQEVQTMTHERFDRLDAYLKTLLPPSTDPKG